MKKLLSGLALLAAAIAAHSDTDALSSAEQSKAFVDLVAGIITCSTRPCLGDGVRHVREVVDDAIVTDGISNYSDLDVAYPSVAGVLQGIVEWDSHERIGLKITDFAVAPPVVTTLLGQSLEGCVIEWAADDPEREDKVPVLTASCTAIGTECRRVSVDVYFGHDLLMVRMSL